MFMLEVTTSSEPLFSKSSTITPPAIEKELIPAAGATSTKWGAGSFDSNTDGEIRYFGGTADG